MTREEWRGWGLRFGWSLAELFQGGAEFRTLNPDAEQGYEFVVISDKVRRDIDDAIQQST